MSVVLVTGASGRVGRRLVAQLLGSHEVICLSRHRPVAGGSWIEGDFSRSESAALLSRPIDVVVHLAAETAGDDVACLGVNAIGTLRFIENMVGRGTRRFVLASSIAAIGCLRPGFRPSQIPIDDDYPCEATDAYGFSKAVMEEAALLISRRHPEVELLIFRIGVIVEHHRALPARTPDMTIADVSPVSMTEVVETICSSVDRPFSPGATRINLVHGFNEPDGTHEQWFDVDRLTNLFDAVRDLS